MKKKIAIVGSVGLPAKYGGWETLVDQLTTNLSSKFAFTVYCSSKRYDQKIDEVNGAKLRYINLNANGIQSIFYDFLSIIDAIKYADTILVLGVSGCIFMPFIKLISRKKFIINIDGLEWRREKWGGATKLFLRISELLAVHFADQIVADNRAIQTYIMSAYSKKSILIAYSGDNANNSAIHNPPPADLNLKGKLYAFKVCRIEPENNIHLIVEAFQEYAGIDLVIVGNWNNSDYGSKLRLKFRNYDHIHLVDPIYELDKLNKIRMGCYIYIHGHSAGGTNPSLVEAMSLGLPVAAYDCIFNRETTYNRALYFNSSIQLKKLLEHFTSDDAKSLGSDLLRIAKIYYTWEKITHEYSKIL